VARLRGIITGLVGAALATAPLSICAQNAPSIKLKPATAKLDEEFTSIVSVRELSDGRVLISDGRENRIVVADFTTGAVAQIGRTGSGPGEYQSAGVLYPIGGDSTLMIDLRGARWNLFDGAKLALALPPDAPIVAAIGRSITGADARGNVSRTMASPLGTPTGGAGRGAPPGGGRATPPVATKLPGDLPDSAFVIRGRRSDAHLDTLARVKSRKMVMNTTTNAKGEITGINLITPPLSVGDETALFADGWLAIVRIEPYRVEWVSPDGKVTKGDPLPWQAVKVDNREKEAYIRARSRSGGGPGPMPEAMRREFDAASKLFPDAYPPVVPGGAIAMPDGRLLVRHPATADLPNARYDIVDRRGKLAGTVALAKGEEIVSFGAKAAYVVWKDDDDIERVRRHPWP
jgi:hypothetical protein